MSLAVFLKGCRRAMLTAWRCRYGRKSRRLCQYPLSARIRKRGGAAASSPSGSGPRPGERKAAHRADAHFAAHAVAGDLSDELKRQRHRVGDRDLPVDGIVANGSVEDFRGIAIG